MKQVFNIRRTIVDFGCLIIRSFEIAFQIRPARLVDAVRVAESVVGRQEERRRSQHRSAIGSHAHTRRPVQVRVVIRIVMSTYAAHSVSIIGRHAQHGICFKFVGSRSVAADRVQIVQRKVGGLADAGRV